MDHDERALVHEFLCEVRKLNLNLNYMASALENLTASTTRLTASVDAAVTVINTPHPTDAQVQTAADLINAQSDRLDGAVNPPAPAPTPTPTP
jgi:hypothetical protein